MKHVLHRALGFSKWKTNIYPLHIPYQEINQAQLRFAWKASLIIASTELAFSVVIFLHGRFFYWKKRERGRGGGISGMCTVSMHGYYAAVKAVCSCFSCAAILACCMVEFVMITEQNGKHKRYNSSPFDQPKQQTSSYCVTHFKIYCILHDFSHDQDEATGNK